MADHKTAWLLLGSRSINKRAALFAESLESRGYDVRLLALPRKSWNLTAFERWQPEVTSPWSARVVSSGSGWRPSVVFAMHWIGLPAALLMRLSGARVFYDECDDYALNANEGSFLSRRVSPWLVSVVHRLALPFVTHAFCIHMAGGALARKLEHAGAGVLEVHNYPTRRWLHVSDMPAAGPLRVVYSGGIWREKGCLKALEAVTRARAENIDIEYHVFGAGDEELVSLLRTAPATFVHGPAETSQIIEFLHAHRCIGIALYSDTPRYRLIGTNAHKIFEYMASGTPVASTRLGEIAQVVTTTTGCLLSLDHTVDDLTEFLKDLGRDDGLWSKLSRGCLERVRSESLDWESEWQRVGEVLDRYGC